jgi:hypothetical protein
VTSGASVPTTFPPPHADTDRLCSIRHLQNRVEWFEPIFSSAFFFCSWMHPGFYNYFIHKLLYVHE